jgi:hypothetical protein
MPRRDHYDKNERQGVKERLRDLIRSDFGSRGKFEKTVSGIRHTTVSAWFHRDPKVPDANSLKILAEQCGWSADYVLFGRGPERLDALRPRAELEAALRTEVVARLTIEFETTPEFIAAICQFVAPPPDGAIKAAANGLRDLVAREVNLVQRWVDLRNRPLFPPSGLGSAMDIAKDEMERAWFDTDWVRVKTYPPWWVRGDQLAQQFGPGQHMTAVEKLRRDLVRVVEDFITRDEPPFAGASLPDIPAES